MNWTTFIIYLFGAYFLYYLINVALDLLSFAPGEAQHESFPVYLIDTEQEPIDASMIIEEEFAAEESSTLCSGELDAPGALLVSRLITQGQAEAIEYTKTVI
ncbi:hypothetical protein [Pedobacter sp. Leaf250]|uniref:hypothetical protein n=1 Tax=Pedobacter sp. Leaf250 TaxID=2876559 RepID=UPI001E3FBC6B|nr:hypothetical protein [Pedobacter sp. Leaf250]